jgi:flavin reductase (DIM6/NTAB) family NADH-FMN oxidoreductase RutF
VSSAVFHAVHANAFRRACGLFATGVAVLTTRAENGAPHGITINSFCSLSLNPPLVIVAVAHDCTFLAHFQNCPFYAVNILREEQQDLSIRFAQLPEARFSGIPWKEASTGSPWIEGVLGMIDCKTVQIFDAGDHRMLIGEVVDVSISEGRPLVFYRGDYRALL